MILTLCASGRTKAWQLTGVPAQLWALGQAAFCSLAAR